MKHLSWHYPIVCQTRKEDFIALGKDVVGGDIISASSTPAHVILRKILGEDVHSHGRGFPFPEIASLLARKAIYTPHNNTIGSRPLTRLIRRIVINRYDKIISQTEYGKEMLAKAGVRREKISVLPMPVDYSYFSRPTGGERFRKRFRLGKGPFVLGIGIRPLKNPDVIAKACELASIKAVLVGPYTKAGVNKIWNGRGFEWYLPHKNILDNDNIVLTGQLQARDILAAFDAATIYAQSATYETFGIAVYEAASSGLPLCLANYGTFAAFKGCALFHKPNNPVQLAKNITTYLDNPDLRKRNGRMAKEIANRFDYPIVKKMYADFYRSMGLL